MIEKMKTVVDDSKRARQERDTAIHDYNNLLNELIKIRNERDTAIQERDIANDEIKQLKISFKEAVNLAKTTFEEFKKGRSKKDPQ